MHRTLERLTPGMEILYGGDKIASVSAQLARRFAAGDRLLVIQESGELLHIPASVHRLAGAAVERAQAAFEAMTRVSDGAVTAFFDAFAARLAKGEAWSAIAAANAEDVSRAASAGRSTARLVAGEAMRGEMIEGLIAWRDAAPSRGRRIEYLEHAGWSLEQVTAPLGVVGFVFEGRPNVLADATGVLRGGNSLVLRIGADALGTARAMERHALSPALEKAGLPAGAVCLIDSEDHAAGWAMFADRRLALAVARGSGRAVAQLGAIARQAGTPVSLHGTGGAWLVAGESADAQRFAAAAHASLDRKVCNTLNVCCIVAARAGELVPLFVDALARAGADRGQVGRLHVTPGAEAWLGEGRGLAVETLPIEELGREWEWEDAPEVSLAVVADLEEAMSLFNRYSPRFIASLIAEDQEAQARFFAGVEAAFVGDGFTRWVDGQYAFGTPELGLANWQDGRLFARGGVLSSDGVFTVRTRMTQTDPALRR
jgi:glutamate-5-semialdehyde dehydrogenase